MGRRTVLLILGLVALIGGLPLGWLAVQREARVVALSAGDGRVAWSAAIEPERANERAVLYRQAAGGGRVAVTAVMDGEGSGSREDRFRLVLFDAAGARRWVFAPTVEELGEPRAADSAWVAPLVADDAVYVTLSIRANRAGAPTPDRLVALDAETGRVRWTFAPVDRRDADRHSAAVAAGDLIIVPTRGDAGQALQALDLATGRPVWRAELGAARLTPTSSGSVVAADSGLVAVLTDSGVFAFDARTGAHRYAIEAGRAYGQLWLAGGVLYVSGPDHRSILAFEAATGAPRWDFQPDGLTGVLRTFRAGGDALYAWCLCRPDGERFDDPRFLAIDAGQGRERWRASPPLGGRRPPSDLQFAPGLVLVAGDAVAAIDAADGTVRWQVSNVRSGAAVDGERVYVTRSAPRWRHWLAYLDQAWADDD